MIMRRTVLASSFALLLVAPLASAQTVEHGDVAPMIQSINAERARLSLPALTEDPRLDAIAESHSMDMARAHYFSHTSPTTGQPAERVTQAGLGWTAVAENIALNQSPEAAQQALLRSPGHHENMVDPGQRSVGVGIVRHGDQVWVTQLFATLHHPLATAVAPPPAGPTPTAPMVTAAPAVEGGEEDPGADCEEDVRDEPEVAPPPSAPAAPVAPMVAGLPTQGFAGLAQLLTGLGLTRQPTATARTASTPAAQFYTVQTPFGPVRVELPAATVAPTVATPAAPAAAPARRARSPRSHHPAPPRGRVFEVDPFDV